MSLKDELNKSQELLLQQRLMYINIANELNTKQKQALNKSIQDDEITKSVVEDIAGQLASNYFGLNDMNITADQLAEYMIHFSYEGGDPLDDEIARKDALNATSGDTFSRFSTADRDMLENSIKVFGKSKNRSAKGENSNAAQQNYRTGKENIDELSNTKAEARLEADHVIARSTWAVPDWLSSQGKSEIKDIADSVDNFQMIDWKANRIKSDNKVYVDNNGKIIPVTYTEKQPEGTTDITKIATASQRNEAFVGSIEKAANNAKLTIANSSDTKKVKAAEAALQELKKNNYLDEDGSKVNPEVSKKNLERLTVVQEKTDSIVAKDFIRNGTAQAKQAGKQVVGGHVVYNKDGSIKTNRRGKAVKKGGLKDLLIGQVVYYTLPPVIFEIKKNIKRGKSADNILKRLKKSLTKISKFLKHKLKNIMKNLSGGLARNFVRTLLDTLISALKGSLSLIFKGIRDFLMAIISSVKILGNPNMNWQEKGNAVVNILTTTTIGLVVSVVLDKVKIDWIQISLQIILTAVLSSLAMKILEKYDIFDIQYGFNIAKIRQIYQEEAMKFKKQSVQIEKGIKDNQQLVRKQLVGLRNQTNMLKSMNYYADSAYETLNVVNRQFDMGVDFDKEWNQFLMRR